MPAHTRPLYCCHCINCCIYCISLLAFTAAAVHVGTGLTVRPRVYNDQGAIVAAAPFTLHVVLTGIAADMIARQKLLKAVGCTGYLGCFWCGMTGTYFAKKGIRLLVYSTAVPISRGLKKGLSAQMHQHAAQLKYSQGEQSLRASTATQCCADDPELAHFIGLHGESVLMHMLWYSDINRLFFVPVAHTFLRGVLHSFLLAITGQRGEGAADSSNTTANGYAPWRMPSKYKLTPAVLSEATSRHRAMVVTQDFGRPPVSLGSDLKGATMEELSHGLDTVLPLLLAGVSIYCALHAILYNFLLRITL